MIDLKIIAVRDILPVTDAGYAQGVSPVTLHIKGTQFLRAQEVTINRVSSPEFVVLHDAEILAQVPFGMEKMEITELLVLAESPSIDRASVITLNLGRSFRGLRGIERLVQLFIKILLQTPGSNQFRPQMGGGLLSLVGSDQLQGNAIKIAVSQAVAQTRNQILDVQSSRPRIPADERLLSAGITAMGYRPETTSHNAQIAISSVAGSQAIANLTF